MTNIINSENSIDDLLHNIDAPGFSNQIKIPGFTLPGGHLFIVHGSGDYMMIAQNNQIDINRRALWDEIRTSPSVYSTASADELKATLLRLVNAGAPVTGGKRRNRRTKHRRTKHRRTKSRR